MRAGRLDTTITVQRSTRTIDPAGTPTVVWSDVATVRAEILQSGTEEFIRAYGASDETVTLFRIRFIDGITPDNRVMLGGTPHDIKQVTELRRRRGLELRTVAK